MEKANPEFRGLLLCAKRVVSLRVVRYFSWGVAVSRDNLCANQVPIIFYFRSAVKSERNDLFKVLPELVPLLQTKIVKWHTFDEMS